MIGLLRERPQRGKGGFRNLERLAQDFDLLFAKYCQDIPQGRVTGEKALQSFLIADAYQNGRRLASMNAAARATTDPVDLVFVTDEIPPREARSCATSSLFDGMQDVRRPF
jgi:hypothetical protein